MANEELLFRALNLMADELSMHPPEGMEVSRFKRDYIVSHFLKSAAESIKSELDEKDTVQKFLELRARESAALTRAVEAEYKVHCIKSYLFDKGM